MPAQEQGIGHAMAGGMVLRNRVPAVMLDRDPGLRADRLDANLGPGGLIRREARLTLGEGEQLARSPPGVDFAGEDLEGPLRARGHSERDEDR